jgi:hypothetical protein
VYFEVKQFEKDKDKDKDKDNNDKFKDFLRNSKANENIIINDNYSNFGVQSETFFIPKEN